VIHRRGFTLVELIVVISVIVILAALLIPVVGMFQRQAARTATQALVARVMAGVNAYAQDRGTLSTQPIAPMAVRADGSTVTALSANDWATVRSVGTTLYREIASTDPDGKNRPRPGYLAQDLRPSEVDPGTGDGPFLVDRWGNPLIYLAWNGTTMGTYQSPILVWPRRVGEPVTLPANIGFRRPGFDRSAECWSAGPDGLFSGLIAFTGDDADNIADPDTEAAANR
jgi:prepilin-type N-terminal cleavage/methylation domain-containing protein